MRRIVFALFAIMISSGRATAQQPPRLDQNSVVKDTTGTILPYPVWAQLLSTGRYKIKSEKKENPEFVLFRLSESDYEKALENAPKPKESIYFKTGSRFSHFKTTDINGNKINTKILAGKIIVLNFWFIQCPPCIKEMPDLNAIADIYKNDSSVVFLGISTDDKYRLEQFLKTTRFAYTIIDNGRFISDQYRIQGYPTNVVVDPEGKVYFHSTGFALNTGLWIKKSIEEIKTKSIAKAAPINNYFPSGNNY
jgi:thiol-disulfide isomerase/thioredoxin